jgi:hypothetical protein
MFWLCGAAIDSDHAGGQVHVHLCISIDSVDG